MYSYIKGIIIDVQKDHIVLENQGIGYHILVSNPYDFKKEQETIVYVYLQVKEDAHTFFGFATKDQKELFLKLILVKGIGCKTAIGMLAIGNTQDIIVAIESKNIAFLKKIPGIGPKAAQQIILDLHGKFPVMVASTFAISNESFEEAKEVLLALGYRANEVDKVMGTLHNEALDTNGYVKKALSLLVK
ncbi:Holliday junction branch migration protein RuvA [Tannockella kyphosi]|uniref:Holliday junction branch migration protein RuvA n=1 Tax=Tannockella kyphosi TaxID=2899121 RepID=UPI0020129327|nr:Holliday junction branch migration protein RuvA [Tannockella kyphosi]